MYTREGHGEAAEPPSARSIPSSSRAGTPPTTAGSCACGLRPHLGFVPVQAERTRDGKLEFAMRIKSSDALKRRAH